MTSAGYSTSKQLMANSERFFEIRHLSLLERFTGRCGTFYGWGRKRSGQRAVKLARRCGSDFRLLEDGFIRSIGLGAAGAPAFSVVEDDVGIYYDATVPSRLENLLNSYDFAADTDLMTRAREGMALIRRYRISKYNHAPDAEAAAFPSDERRVLVVAQTAGDASLTYGLADRFTTGEMIDAAMREHPDAVLYLKIHPDVLHGKKRSDIEIASLPKTCRVITDDVNPVSLLEHFDVVYTKTSQMGFEALMLGKRCVCFGMPFYAGWGVTDDRVSCPRRTARRSVEEIFAASYILYSRYANPYTFKPSDIIDTIETIVRFRERERPVAASAYFFGFSYWKHTMVAPFFTEIAPQRRYFINPWFGRGDLKNALKRGLDAQSRIYIWGRKAFDEVEAYAAAQGIPIYRVEDGFIRSVGLGSDLTQPYSQVVDSRGIYFDPTTPSDLENLLAFYEFDSDPELLERARRLREYIVEAKLSKYSPYAETELDVPKGRAVVVVPGQVENDASIRYGAPGMTNLKLLQEVRAARPDAYILYKPHPDVLSGNRPGAVPVSEALRYCNRVVTEVAIDSVLAQADELHTMTSLVGFEALMRGIPVTTYGMPFYAGWGLTEDRGHCERRKQSVTIDALVAAALILYPRYIHPKSRQSCEVEALLEAMEAERARIRNAGFARRLQQWRNLLSRKLQFLWRLGHHERL